MAETKERGVPGETEQPAQKWVMPTEVFSRCVGYLRPVEFWNSGKQQEFKDRVTYLPRAPAWKKPDEDDPIHR